MVTQQATVRVAHLYVRVNAVVPPFEWPVFAEDVDAILALKRERGAVVLTHNYQTPKIFHCVADVAGDSLTLAREAMRHWIEIPDEVAPRARRAVERMLAL
jgi:quinolinate synthase